MRDRTCTGVPNSVIPDQNKEQDEEAMGRILQFDQFTRVQYYDSVPDLVLKSEAIQLSALLAVNEQMREMVQSSRQEETVKNQEKGLDRRRQAQCQQVSLKLRGGGRGGGRTSWTRRISGSTRISVIRHNF